MKYLYPLLIFVPITIAAELLHWNEVLVFNGSHQDKTPEDRRRNTVNVVSVELAVKKKEKGTS